MLSVDVCACVLAVSVVHIVQLSVLVKKQV